MPPCLDDRARGLNVVFQQPVVWSSRTTQFFCSNPLASKDKCIQDIR